MILKYQTRDYQKPVSKNSDQLEWTHAYESCVKIDVIVVPRIHSEALESDEMLMSVGTCQRAILLIGLEDVLKPDFEGVRSSFE